MSHSDEVKEVRDFRGLSFENGSFANQSLVGAKFTHCRFKNVSFASAELKKANFSHCHFEGVDFSSSSLVETDFSHSHFTAGANFTSARLWQANFTQADASGAVFDMADLSFTVFHETNLFEASFHTDTRYAFFKGAAIENAKFTYGPAPWEDDEEEAGEEDPDFEPDGDSWWVND